MLIPVLPVLRALGLALLLAALLANGLSLFSYFAPLLLVMKMVRLVASATPQFILRTGLLQGVLHGMPYVSEEGQLLSHLPGFLGNPSPFHHHHIIQAIPDFVLNGIPFITRDPHDPGDLIQEVIDAGSVTELLPLDGGLLPGDSLTKSCSEGGLEPVPVGIAWVQVDGASYPGGIPLANLEMVGPVPLVGSVLHELASVPDLPDIIAESVGLHLKLLVHLQKEPLQVLRIPSERLRVLHLAVPLVCRYLLLLGHNALEILGCISQCLTLSSPSHPSLPPPRMTAMVWLWVRVHIRIWIWISTSSTSHFGWLLSSASSCTPSCPFCR